MVSEYVTRLYTPAAIASRTFVRDDYALGRDLAEWKARVRGGWSGVCVEHVEASGIGDMPALGAPLHVRAYVRLGDLRPEDVLVQVVFGRVDEQDLLVAPNTVDLRSEESQDGIRWLFVGDVCLERTGPFGYTVRVLPRHDGLVSPVEMGLLVVPALPEEPAAVALR